MLLLTIPLLMKLGSNTDVNYTLLEVYPHSYHSTYRPEVPLILLRNKMSDPASGDGGKKKKPDLIPSINLSLCLSIPPY